MSLWCRSTSVAKKYWISNSVLGRAMGWRWVSSYEREMKVLPAAKTSHASLGSPTYSIINGQHAGGGDEEDEVKIAFAMWTSSSCALYSGERTEPFLSNTIRTSYWCTIIAFVNWHWVYCSKNDKGIRLAKYTRIYRRI